MLRHIDLQLFAEGETGEPGNAGEGAADLNQGEQGQGSEGQGSAEKDPAKAFAARLGHERKKIAAEYEPYKAVIERQAKAANMEPGDYLKYIQQQQEQQELEAEAERTGKTPEVLKAEKEKAEAEARAARLERKEKLTAEEKELISDPKIGAFVTDNLAKIREIADKTDTDLRTGLALILMEKLPELLEQADVAKNKEAHVKEYLESLKKGGKPIEIGGGTVVASAGSPKTFDDAKKAALEILKAQKQS